MHRQSLLSSLFLGFTTPSFSSALLNKSSLFRSISLNINPLLCLCAPMLLESIAFQRCTQQICAIAVLSNSGQFHCAANRFTSCLSYSKAGHWIALPLQHFVLLRFSIARPRRSTLCLCGTSNFSAFAGLVRSGPSWRIPYHRLTNASLHLALPLLGNAFRAIALLAKRCFAHAMRVRTVLCLRKAYQNHAIAWLFHSLPLHHPWYVHVWVLVP